MLSLESWWFFNCSIGFLRLQLGPCFDLQPFAMTAGNQLKIGLCVDSNNKSCLNTGGGSLTIKTPSVTASVEVNTNLNVNEIQRSASIKTNRENGVGIGVQSKSTESTSSEMQGWEFLQPINFLKNAKIIVSYDTIFGSYDTDISAILPLKSTFKYVESEEEGLTFVLTSDENLQDEEFLNFIMPSGGARANRELRTCQLAVGPVPRPDIPKNHAVISRSALAAAVFIFFMFLLHKIKNFFKDREN